MAQFIDYYKILQVDPSAEPDIIEAAYKKLSKLYHPDINKDPGAEEKYKEITEAYFVLKNPNNRSKYDIIYENFYKPRPKPEVDKSYILFEDVTPGETKTGSFVLRNSGGDYENIDVSVQTPNSWLKITGLNSLNSNQSDELPLKVELEANVDEWDKNYNEYIIVKLDDDEIRIKVELNTKTKVKPQPAFNKKKLIPIIILPILFLVFSCIGINYLISSCSKQNNKTIETESSAAAASLAETSNSSKKISDFNGQIAFLKNFPLFYASNEDKNIYILDSENNDERTINLDMYWQEPVSKNICWSPDGSKIAIGLGMDLYTINIIDSETKKIFTLQTNRVDDEDNIDNRGYYESIAWSPDGKKILFTVSPHTDSNEYNDAVSNKIILIDSDGKNNQIVLENNELRYLGLAWSPDGKKIVYSTGKSRTWYLLDEYRNVSNQFPFDGYVKLWIMDINNNFKTTQIADFKGWTNTVNLDGKYITNCRWSPDGKQILFDLIKKDGAPSGYDTETLMVYSIDSNGENVKEFLQGYSPNWSRDGNEIIYGGIEYNEDHELPIIFKDIKNGISEKIGWGVNPAWYSKE